MSLTSCMALLSFSLSPAVAGEKTAKTDKLKPAAFDSMRHGSCHAGNKASDPKAIGGYGASTNFPKPLPKGEKLRGKKLYLEITGKEDAEFPGKFEGMEIRLVNGGAKTASISASDSRLSLVQEAKDADGEWKPVESLPRTFCGNSYHHDGRAYVDELSPHYQGEEADSSHDMGGVDDERRDGCEHH